LILSGIATGGSWLCYFKALQLGNMNKVTPVALSNAYWCSIQGIAEQYAMHPEIPLPEAEWIVDIIKLK